MRPGDNSGMMTMPENQEMDATGSRPSGGAAGATLYIAYLHVLWTLLYGFVIFPNHPTPDMLECHEEVSHNNQTEALERDKTCELDTQTMWGLAFLASVASSVFSIVAIVKTGDVFVGVLGYDPNDPFVFVGQLFGPPAVLWTLLYGFVIFPNHPSPDMLECHEEVYYNNQTEALERDKTCELDRPLIWGLAFLAGVASSVFSIVAIALVGICIDLFTDHYFPSRSQNDTVEQEEEDTA
jgi:hypothetical protein